MGLLQRLRTRECFHRWASKMLSFRCPVKMADASSPAIELNPNPPPHLSQNSTNPNPSLAKPYITRSPQGSGRRRMVQKSKLHTPPRWIC